MNNTQTYSITQLRQNTAEAIKTAILKQQPVVILQRSKPKAILADIRYFEALEQVVLDLTDSREAERAKKEPKSSFNKYFKKRWGASK